MFQAAIKFFENNLNLFDEHILKDYEYWHVKMLEWLKAGTEESKSSITFLKSFLQALGTIMENKDGSEYTTVTNVSIFIVKKIFFLCIQ